MGLRTLKKSCRMNEGLWRLQNDHPVMPGVRSVACWMLDATYTIGSLFSVHAQFMRLALVMVVDDFQAEVAISFDEWRSNLRQWTAPLATVFTVHGVGVGVILEPEVGVQPARAEPAALACGGWWRLWVRWLDDRHFLLAHHRGAGWRACRFRRNKVSRGRNQVGNRFRRVIYLLRLLGGQIATYRSVGVHGMHPVGLRAGRRGNGFNILKVFALPWYTRLLTEKAIQLFSSQKTERWNGTQSNLWDIVNL